MHETLRRLTPQPLLGITFTLLAFGMLIVTAQLYPAVQPLPSPILIAALIAAVVAAYRYPIHVRAHTKVAITSIPLFLIVVLMPVFSAAITAGIGVLMGESVMRAQRGNTFSDVVTSGSRWVMVVIVSALVAHIPVTNAMHYSALLFLTAMIMFAGDVVTAAGEVAAMSHEPFGLLLASIVRACASVEAIQYLLGILGALVAMHHPWALLLIAIPGVVVYLAFKNVKEMREGTRQLLESLADTVDLRDPYTGGHSRRVTALCAGILRELGMTGPEANLIVAAARVHDIGKIAVPDDILRKADQLTAEEWVIMQAHAASGAEFLKRYPDFARGAGIVRHHHERWDGRGYPGRLAGYAIPLGARVIAVADSFDAMTSDRPYRRGMSAEIAAELLAQGSGVQWDPQIVAAFLRSIADRLPSSAVVSMPLGSQPRTAA